MTKQQKTLEEVIASEIAHFNETHKVPTRLSDDCSQEIAIAIIQVYDRISERDPWYVMERIRDTVRQAGEKFLEKEMQHEAHFSHEKGDDEFLCECTRCYIRHRAVCSSLSDTIKTILAETGFTERESQVILMVLDAPGGKGTFVEIGEQLGVSGTLARQIYFKAIHKFRHPKRSKILKDYFDIL